MKPKKTKGKRKDVTETLSPRVYLYTVLGHLLRDLEVFERLDAVTSMKDPSIADGACISIFKLGTALIKLRKPSELARLSAHELEGLRRDADDNIKLWEQALRRGGGEDLASLLRKDLAYTLLDGFEREGEISKRKARAIAAKAAEVDDHTIKRWQRDKLSRR